MNLVVVTDEGKEQINEFEELGPVTRRLGNELKRYYQRQEVSYEQFFEQWYV